LRRALNAVPPSRGSRREIRRKRRRHRRPPPPQAAPAAQSLPNNVAGALAYVTPIPAIIFLLIDPFKTIRFVRFHSLQSIIFCVTAFVLQFALGIVSIVLGFMGIAFIGLLGTLISLGIFVLWIVLVIKAYQGQEFQLPVISGLAAKWL
jgi:uncharacterized membrane protein